MQNKEDIFFHGYLLLNKTEATYTRFSREVFNKVNGNDPEDILLELEKSAINAIKNI